MSSKVVICGVNTATLPRLTEEETNALLVKLKQGDNLARERFIVANFRLVLSVIKRFKLKFIQTLPPIKNNFYNEKTYLVCTKNTAKSNFVKEYKKAVKVLPAPQLATKIEKGIFNLNKVNDDIFNFLPKQDISVLILGCTHYCFLLNKFTKALPNVQIIQPEYLSMLALNDFLSENNLKNQSSVDGKIHFIGENAYYNRYVYENFCLKN